MISLRYPEHQFPPKTVCYGAEDCYYTTREKYRIYSKAMTPNLDSGKYKIYRESIDQILINSSKCKLKVIYYIDLQNFLSTLYIGRIPLVFYGIKTKIGEEFQMTILNNDISNRYFCKREDDFVGTHIGDVESLYQN